MCIVFDSFSSENPQFQVWCKLVECSGDESTKRNFSLLPDQAIVVP